MGITPETSEEDIVSQVENKMEFFINEFPEDLCEWPIHQESFERVSALGLSHSCQSEVIKSGAINRYGEEITVSKKILSRSVLGRSWLEKVSYGLTVMPVTPRDGTHRSWNLNMEDGSLVRSHVKPGWDLKLKLSKARLAPGTLNYDEELRNIARELDEFIGVVS